jgi:hypothetical protein
LRFRVLGSCAVLAACAGGEPRRSPDTVRAAAGAAACDSSAARAVVERFGERLRDVALLGPDTAVARAMREAYGPFVTSRLLDGWVARPDSAPGRTVSSPWPARIAIDSVEPAGPSTCRVSGYVVYVTSVEEARGGAASRERVVLRVVNDGGWRIASYEAVGPERAAAAAADSLGGESAADVVRRYYDAVGRRDFRTAYLMWEGDGAASRQSLEEFAAGFRTTARVTAEVGTPGRVEGAAGSRYVTVPVVTQAETQSGERQRFEGTYTLRRSVVDGASPEQRRWHIYSARIRRVRGGG